jgi:integrase
MLSLLKRGYLEAGRPDGEQLVCPPHYRSGSGVMSVGGLGKRAKRRWADARLEPITLQEARHTAATWLDAAGVSPKIASVLMGHATPTRQAGAAQITLARYTHALPADVERARGQLAAYLAAGVRPSVAEGSS